MAPRSNTMTRAGTDDSEDDLASPAITSNPVVGKRVAAKTTKAKTAARRVSAGKGASKRKAPQKQARQPLKDRTNVPDGNETEEVDAFDDDDMATKPKAKRQKTTGARKNVEIAATKDVVKKVAGKRGRPARRARSPEPLLTIPETLPEPELVENVEQSIEIDPENMDIAQEPTPKQKQTWVQRPPPVQIQPLVPRPSARAGSAQPMYPRTRERSGSASGTERRGGDPELRRQLNETNKKYEDLQLKYESLQEIGKNHAETNFEKLKRASDMKAKDASELVASLKRELAEVRKSTSGSSSETAGFQNQIKSLIASNDKLTAERDELKNKLQVSQNETKSLETKLVAARQQLSNSTLETKTNDAAKKPINGIAVQASNTMKEAKMKENLYADLTGLIIRGVKRKEEGEDEYDCIQTGRNGTLHFHLSVGNESTTPHPKTPSGLNYEDTEFAYEPLLDDNRDKELLNILPDYLTEEIVFPRVHAQRFYGKVVDSMTKIIIVEDDD